MRVISLTGRPADKLRTVVATETRTATHLETVTVTNFDTVFTTIVETVVVETQTITTTSAAMISSAPAKLRRQVLTAVSDYPAASISSACSCLNVRNCNKKGTTTLAAATETSVATTVTIDTTETSTATDVATTTIQTTVTSSATATTVVTAAPSVAPRGSRLVTIGESGEKRYFKSVVQEGSGDLIVITSDPSQAIDTFQFKDGRLSYTSPTLNGQTVYPYFPTIWYSDATPKKLIFNTAEFIDDWMSFNWYHYEWVADANTGALKVTNAGVPVYSQLCLAGINMLLEEELMLGTRLPVDGSFCLPVTISLELV
jgi:hypothetical protein